MIANHLNFFGPGGGIFCEQAHTIINGYDPGFFEKNCKQCPYYNGLIHPDRGVECKYDDPYAETDWITVTEPSRFLDSRAERKKYEEPDLSNGLTLEDV